MFFDKDWSGPKCKLVGWMTQYSAIARDDYKRCVCDQWGTGEASCPQGSNDASNIIPGPTPTPTPEPTPTPVIPSVWKTWATLDEIRANPHYSTTSYSRTLYQVDREIDFIEKKIVELYGVAVKAGLI